jgi:hypothetical protein
LLHLLQVSCGSRGRVSLNRRFVPAAAFLILLLLFPRAGRADAPTIETIVGEVRRIEAVREAAIRDMVYTAETQVIEWEDPSRQTVKSETLTVRKVYIRAPDQMHNEYLSMTVDGQELTRREMERELAKQRRGGRQGEGNGGEFQSPFSAEAAPLYDFQLRGADLFDGRPVWIVEFAPKEAQENLFTGTAYVSHEDYQTLYVEMAPAVLPRMLEELAMNIRFAPIGGFSLPAVFEMDMRVRVSFLITLADRTLSIEDRYSDYRLNVGLGDEVFPE